MENLSIKATKYTPKIELIKDGFLNFIGKSYPENTFEFYSPVEEWIKEYVEEKANKKTIVTFDLNYLNSSSIKFYFDLFETLEELALENQYVEVVWLYHKDDEMTLEVGEDFKEDYEDLNITITEKS